MRSKSSTVIGPEDELDEALEDECNVEREANIDVADIVVDDDVVEVETDEPEVATDESEVRAFLILLCNLRICFQML